MEFWIAIGMVAAIVAAVLGILYLRQRKHVEKDTVYFWHRTATNRSYDILHGRVKSTMRQTPAGNFVYYEDGLTPYLEYEQQVDRGIEFAFRKMECNGYTVNRAQHITRVVVLKSERSPESRSWSFREPIWPCVFGPENCYYNSIFDMMSGSEEYIHYVLAAGETIQGNAEFPNDVIALPYVPKGEEDPYVARVAYYEREHVNYMWYDGIKYEETKTHLTGGHPITPVCEGVEEL
jgi:hypothetical protein